MKTTRAKARHHDQEEEEEQLGDWVLARWHLTGWGLTVYFVVEVKGKPRPDYHATAGPREAYRWNSYHAARKFQRAHRKLRGYVILNLSRVGEQAEEQEQHYEEWIAGKYDKAPREVK